MVDSEFPLSADQNYYNVNVLRRSPSYPPPTATVTFSKWSESVSLWGVTGHDLTYLPTVSESPGNVNLVQAGTLFDKTAGGYFGRTVAQGANGDGVVTVDLGGWYTATEVVLTFRLSNPWAAGGSVEISTDKKNWTLIASSPHGSSFGPATPGPFNLTFPAQSVRYVRITDYFVPGVGTSVARLEEVQVF